MRPNSSTNIFHIRFRKSFQVREARYATRHAFIPSAILSSSPNFSDVPEALLSAVEALSRQPRQTIPDISASSGLPITETQTQVANLAALTATPIDVTDDGQIAYRFPRNVRQRLRSNSLRASIRMAWSKLRGPLYTAARIAFGALLILSIVVTFIAIAALSSAARSDDDRRERGSASFMPIRLFAPNPFDVIWYSSRSSRFGARDKQPGEMSFLEAVYSFVFGDGDPNTDLEQRRYRTLARLIRANNGAVTAEQLAPYLDLSGRSQGEGGFVDESFMLPVLQQFGGSPEVTDDGDIIYVFPQFLTTGGGGSVEMIGGRVVPLQEEEQILSRAGPGQKAMVVALGVLNVLAVFTLGAKLLTAVPMTSDAAALVSLLKGVYPALAAYATSFFVIPVLRWLRIGSYNNGVQMRNRARRGAAETLARGNSDVRRKILAAERYALKRDVVRDSNVVYSSDENLVDQQAVQEEMKDEFDRRLNSKG